MQLMKMKNEQYNVHVHVRNSKIMRRSLRAHHSKPRITRNLTLEMLNEYFANMRKGFD